MKKSLQITIGVIAICSMLSLHSCDKIKDNVKIPDINYTGASADIIIPASAAGATGDLATVAISYNIDSMISANTQSLPFKVSYSDIKSVKLTSMVLTIADSDVDVNNNFGNFSVVGATFNTDASGGSLQPYNVTYIDPNPAVYTNVLDVPLIDKDKDLKQYFGAGKLMFTYAVTGTLRTATTHTLHVHIDVTYDLGF